MGKMSHLSRTRHRSGSTVLYVAVFVFIVIGIIFFGLNYEALLGTKSEAQTASEAAALLVAREISSVTVDSSMGKIGLVDMDPQDPRNPFFIARGAANQAPVIGFNTALATLRLDRLIAEDLNNMDMQDLCQRDLDSLKSVARQLNTKVAASVAPNSATWVKAKDIYDQNNRRLGGKVTLDSRSFFIETGRLKDGQGTTNLPVPTPVSGGDLFNDSAAANNSTDNKYRANVDIPIGKVSFAFSAIGDAPKLVSNGLFVSYKDDKYNLAGFGEIPCSVVRISATDIINSLAPGETGAIKSAKMQSESCAEVGSERLHTRSTVYTIGFGGFPSRNAFPEVSIKGLVEYKGWLNPGDHQPSTWLKAKGGDYPAAAGSAANQLVPVAFNPQKSMVQSPGTALAYGIYDWLRSLRLRPRRDEVASLFKQDLRKKTVDREFSVDNSDTSGDEGNDAQANASEDTDTDGDVDASDDDESPTMGCMFRPPTGIDPRYQALVDGNEAGTQLYFNAFNYRAIDSDVCPDTSFPILVDPITGEAKGQAGNNIVELCQLVEGTVASNHAGFTALVAGREVRLDAVEARKANNHIRVMLDEAIATENLLQASRQDPAMLRDKLANLLNNVKSESMTYQNLPLLRTAPISDNNRVFHGQTPRKILDDFQRESRITSADAELQARTYLHGSHDLKALFQQEHERIEDIRRRAGRVRRNGRTAMRKSVRLVRHLRKWSNRGIRRLDIYPSEDLFPSSPSFAVNIRRPSAKRPTGGHVATRVVFIEPNNGTDVVRNGQSARPHFFNLDQVTVNDVELFKKSIEKVETTQDVTHYNQGDFEGDVQLSSGSNLFPMNTKITEMRSDLDPSKQPFARNWDSENTPSKFLVNHHPSRTGLAFMRLYRKLTVGDRSRLTGPMPASMGSYIPLKQLRAQVSQAQKGDSTGTGIQEVDGGQPSDMIPGYEQVFVLSCDGDTSFSQDQGKINVNYVKQPSTHDARYPFGTNQLLSQQYLYFAGSAFEDGKKNDTSMHPTTTFRAVIARDQFADLAQGNSYLLQPSKNWCHPDAGYGLSIGKSTGECAYPAGEWRLGNAYSIACCKLDPDKLAIKVRPRDFESMLQAQSNDGDVDDNDVTTAEPDVDEDQSTCPMLIKPAGRTGKILGFF